MKRTYKLPLVLEPQPEGGYTVRCALIPELITEADTLDEIRDNVADALAALLEMYEDLGKPIPPALKSLVAESDIPLVADVLVTA